VGSAILYGDFKKATFHQMVTLLYGCAATFAGVFIIAWSSDNKVNGFEAPEDEAENASVTDVSGDVEQGNIQPGFGSLSRRRATLVLPPGSKSNEVLRHKHSAVSIMGLSPAQVCGSDRYICSLSI
jgi:magnesium transporter